VNGNTGAANGSPASASGFVPLQVTKKTTPRKQAGLPPSSSEELAAAAEPLVEGAAGLSEDGTARAAKPAGRGRLFRKAPKKNRLACKF